MAEYSWLQLSPLRRGVAMEMRRVELLDELHSARQLENGRETFDLLQKEWHMLRSARNANVESVIEQVRNKCYLLYT